jgi:hypothetical protein
MNRSVYNTRRKDVGEFSAEKDDLRRVIHPDEKGYQAAERAVGRR